MLQLIHVEKLLVDLVQGPVISDLVGVAGQLAHDALELLPVRVLTSFGLLLKLVEHVVELVLEDCVQGFVGFLVELSQLLGQVQGLRGGFLGHRRHGVVEGWSVF